MRLFNTVPEIDGSILTIREERVLYHAKVVRLCEGDEFLVQWNEGSEVVRCQVILREIGKKKIVGEIAYQEKKSVKGSGVSMLVAVPHSRDVATGIVQKLTEIGVDKISFWCADRSQLCKIFVKKISKIRKIVLESVEQSNGWFVPDIEFLSDIVSGELGENLVVFDGSGVGEVHEMSKVKDADKCLGVIGPEGGLTQEELKGFASRGATFVSLGENILRMETAAVIGAWWIKNKTNS